MADAAIANPPPRRRPDAIAGHAITASSSGISCIHHTPISAPQTNRIERMNAVIASPDIGARIGGASCAYVPELGSIRGLLGAGCAWPRGGLAESYATRSQTGMPAPLAMSRSV